MGTFNDLRTEQRNFPIIAWDNRAQSASGSTTADGFSAAAALTYASYEGWRPVDGFGSLEVVVSATIDYAAAYIVGSGAVTVSRVTGTTVTPLGIYQGPGAIFVAFDPVSVGAIRLGVSDLTGYVANVMAGRLTELQRKIYVGHTPIKFGRQVDRVQGLSESGAFLGTIVRRQTNATRIDASNITPDYYRSVLDPFVQASTRQAHYWSYRREIPQGAPQQLLWGAAVMVWGTEAITAQGFVSDADQVAYAQVQGDPSVENSLGNGMMSAGWDIIALP